VPYLPSVRVSSLKNELFDLPIPTLVVRKAVPMVFGVLAILLFTLVDTWFISLLGTKPLAALSYSFPVTFIVSSLAMGMGIGLASNVGRFLGSGRKELAERFTTDSLILTTLLVAVLSFFGLVFNDPIFRLLGATDDVLYYIREYMLVWYFGIPLLVIPMVGNSAIRASGDVKTPSLVMLLAGVVNGVLDPIFIFVLDLGVRGAALATVVSWMITFVVAVHMLKNKLNLLTFVKPNWLTMKNNWKLLIKIGLPASMAQMLNPIANAIVVALLSSFGVAGVAAFGVGSRLEAIILIFVMALGSVMPTVLGQNYGAKLYQRSAQTIRFAMHGIIVLYLVFYGLVYFLAKPLASLFTNDPEVLELATLYLRIMPLSYAWLGVGIVTSQVLNVLARPMSSLLINLFRLFVFLVPLAWCGGYFYGVLGVYWGVAIAHISSGVLIYMYGLRVAKQIASETLD
jgi:putative MATE family efflux protein